MIHLVLSSSLPPFLPWHLTLCHCLSSASPPGGSTSPFSSPITSDEEYLSPPEEFPEPGEIWPQTPTMKPSPSQNRRSSDTGSKAPPTFKVRPLRLAPAPAPWQTLFLHVAPCSWGHTRFQHSLELCPINPFYPEPASVRLGWKRPLSQIPQPPGVKAGR